MSIFLFAFVGFVSFIILWVLFTNIMVWKEKEHFIPTWLKFFLYPIVAVAYILDVLFNWIFGTVLFLQLPKKPTLSERLRRILLTEDGWRWGLAFHICKHYIEPWDQGHCGLGYK